MLKYVAVGLVVLICIVLILLTRPPKKTATDGVPKVDVPPGEKTGAPPVGHDAGQEISLLNGRDLEGWEHLGGGKFFVEAGQLVAESDAQHRPGYLITKLVAQNFHARWSCKVSKGDSGFLFRCQRDPRTPTEVIGPQVQLNVEPGRGLGGIFELQGRGWVRKTPADKNAELNKNSDWFDCELRVEGDHIQASVNSVRTADFTDDPTANAFRKAGFFGIQIHGGSDCDIRFRKISVVVLD